jgi:hypothetical protein
MHVSVRLHGPAGQQARPAAGRQHRTGRHPRNQQKHPKAHSLLTTARRGIGCDALDRGPDGANGREPWASLAVASTRCCARDHELGDDVPAVSHERDRARGRRPRARFDRRGSRRAGHLRVSTLRAERQAGRGAECCRDDRSGHRALRDTARLGSRVEPRSARRTLDGERQEVHEPAEMRRELDVVCAASGCQAASAPRETQRRTTRPERSSNGEHYALRSGITFVFSAELHEAANRH